jgi:hypothetical protein
MLNAPSKRVTGRLRVSYVSIFIVPDSIRVLDAMIETLKYWGCEMKN